MSPSKLDFLKSHTTFIDVRAPVEFALGAIPGAVNLPLLTDNERELVGKIYKLKGQESAIQLGHELVSGKIKEERVSHWVQFCKENPRSLIYCARGGLRSRISQAWLAEAGCEIMRLDGGYKAYRQAVLEVLNRDVQVLSLGGLTGSGKSKLFGRTVTPYSKIDLESLAHHRGSAFGKLGKQPSQSLFENRLAHEIFKIKSQRCLVEDESRLIGQCCLPEKFYQNLRTSPMVFVDELSEVRCQNIIQDYVALPLSQGMTPDELFSNLKTALLALQKKLGGLEYQKILNLMNASLEDIKSGRGFESCEAWVQRLLQNYYDPQYLRSLKRRGVKTLFRGRLDECRDYLDQELSN